MSNKSSLPRQMVKEVVDNISQSSFEDSVADVVKFLNALIDQYGNKVFLEYGQFESYCDSYSYNVCIYRPETDEEYAVRVDTNNRSVKDRILRLEKELAALKGV